MDPKEQLRILLSGAADVIPVEELEERLAGARPLRVKLGIDPSAPDLHLGHAVVLRTLRRFQDLGHTAVLIIGDFTGRIGDPSGQSETRPMLTPERLEANARTYLDQAGTVLDVDRAEIRRNSEWLAPLTFAEVAPLAGRLTVARLLDRDDFQTRYRGGQPISLVEFLYPVMQAYDSVAVEADVEMGGTDQTFNLLVGRDMQRAHDQDPQVVFTVPLLTGTDGTRKMSKSYGNHIGLTEPPEEQFGKAYSIPDERIVEWLRLCTDVDPDEIDRIERGLAEGSLHPAEEKRRLAREIVRLYHGESAARAAEEGYDRIHKEGGVPDDVPEVPIPEGIERGEGGMIWLPRLLQATGLAGSKAEARRLIEQGGVRLDGESIADPEAEFWRRDLEGKVLQVGKRRYARLR